MIAQISSTSVSAPTAAARSEPGAAAGFAALMGGGERGVVPPKGQDTPEPLAEAAAGAEDAETATPETAEGLMALLDDTIAGLHAGSAQVTRKTALAAFAAALGEGPVETVDDLAAVAQLADPETAAALQDKINGALRLAAGVGQLSLASAGVPVVGRVTMASAAPQGLQPGEAAGLTTAADGALREAMGLRQEGGAQPAASLMDARVNLTNADPRAAAPDQFADAVKGLQTANTGSSAEAILREAAPAPQTLTAEPQRFSPPAPAGTAPAPSPTATPDAQLRQHVAQQIRSFETTDNKMRFSLSPYGMGDIEIEVMRGEGGRMQIAMTAESASVLQMLRHDRENLLEALNARGISAESADLDFQTFGERGRQDGRDAPAPMPQMAEGAGQSDDLSDSDASAAPAPRNASGPGQLDILT
ncbi:flagellar hook-length control protein FliK [Sulfitobacter sp. PS-8MA]|uniref:flagellar hook-length control protein FliK n=1 Tax=Sulfitobacter sp. PS-8MA TaxID=3237707 RepID=UPI0034C66404